MSRAHAQEPQLEHAEDVRRVDRADQHLPQLLVARAAGTRDHLRREGRRRHVEVDLGVLEGPEQRIEGSDSGVVEQGPDRGGDRGPWWAVTCAAGSGWRCTTIPSRFTRPAVVGTVTSMIAVPRTILQSAAADA